MFILSAKDRYIFQTPITALYSMLVIEEVLQWMSVRPIRLCHGCVSKGNLIYYSHYSQHQFLTSLLDTNTNNISLKTNIFYTFFTNHTLQYSIVQGDTFFKDLMRYPLGREGVYAPGGPAFLVHTEQKVNNNLGLTALELAFVMG